MLMREWNYAQATKLHLLWISDYKKAISALGYCVLKAQCDKTADRLSKAHILGAHFDVPFVFLAEIFVIK